MITSLFNWLFRKTKIGKLLDGNKTIIGFSILVLRTLVQLLGEAQFVFPEAEAITLISKGLSQLDVAIGDLLEKVGYGVLAVGVTDKAVKAKS
jgi:hypothetical protein